MRLSLLLVVGDLDEPTQILRELTPDFPCPEVSVVADLAAFRDAVPGNAFNLAIVSDRLAWATPIEVLRQLKAERPECPVIFCVDSFDEAILLEAMRAGLNDYVLRTPAHLARLLSWARLALAQLEQRQALVEAERRYQTLFENVPVGLYRSTPQGQLCEVNPAFVKVLGYERPEDLVAKNAADLYVDAADRARWQSRMRDDGVVRDFETRLRQRDGGELWVMEHARAVFGPGGEVLFYEGSVESIAAHKRAHELEPQLRQAQKMEDVGPEPLAAAKGASGTILVVEDDDNLRSLLRLLFKPSGFKILLAPTAEEALALVAGHPEAIHLLIVDVVLPGMSGPDLAKRLRAERPDMRILFTSGYSPEAITRSGALPAEAAFLQKPFTPATLLRLVLEILKR
jgi:PAS domain S-box-containing protein